MYGYYLPCITVVSHVKCTHNIVADLLSRWQESGEDFAKLHQLVDSPVWVDTLESYLTRLYVSDPEAVTAPLNSQAYQEVMTWLLSLQAGFLCAYVPTLHFFAGGPGPVHASDFDSGHTSFHGIYFNQV